MKENVHVGQEGEFAFIQRLNDKGIPYEYTNDWVDFKVNNVPIDVKTTQLSHKFSHRQRKNQQYKVGRFLFTEEQIKQQCYIAFFVRSFFGVEKEHLFLGIAKLPPKCSKYLSIHKLRELDLMDLPTFIRATTGGESRA